jgi:hypothetical protein
MEWNVKALFALPGFMFLSIAVSTLQNTARFFTSDINEIVFIDNWMPWIVVVFLHRGGF